MKKRPSKKAGANAPTRAAKPAKKTAPRTKKLASPAKKPASAKLSASSASAAPPFFGQGDAGYYEWFEMWVLFDAPVPKAERKALLAGAPKPAVRDAQ